jgi:hypothetical protein
MALINNPLFNPNITIDNDIDLNNVTSTNNSSNSTNSSLRHLNAVGRRFM